LKTTINIEKGVKEEIDVRTVRIDVPIDCEKDFPSDLPLRRMVNKTYGGGYYVDEERWIADVDVETGIIKDWVPGCEGEIDVKLVDRGSYYLLDAENKVLVALEDDYVPNRLIPPNDGYGDYMLLIIEPDGRISNWYEKPDFTDFGYEDD